MKNHIISTLRSQRLRLGLAQKDVATMMGGGVVQSMISEWERGETNITLTNLQRWAEVLGCTIIAMEKD